MKSHKLTTKFIITFVGGLLVVFFVLIAVFEITFRLSMNAFIKESAYSMQEELDASLTDVVNEAAFLYSRMLHSDNIALLNKIKDEDESMAERNEGFDNLVQK